MNKLKIQLTKIFLWLHRLEFGDVKEHELPNKIKVEVITFIGDYHFLGQALPTAIIINEKIFSEYPKTCRDIIIAHEYGHIRFSTLFRLILEVISIAILAFELLTFVLSLLLLVLSILNIQNLVLSLFIFFLFFIPSLIVTWLFEADADIYACNELGYGVNDLEREKFVLNIKKCRKIAGEKSSTERIIIRLTHPPEEWVFYLYPRLRRVFIKL